MATKGVWLRLEFFDRTRDMPAALLLSQLVYWSSRAKIFREGYWWIAKSHKDWWRECRLSRRQVDKALALLETKQLVVVEVFRWRGTPVRHVRLHPQVQSIAPLGAVITTEPTEPQKQTSTNVLVESANSGGAMDSKDVLAKMEAKYRPAKGFPDALPKENASTLASKWMAMVPYYHDLLGPMKDLTHKEIGQLSLFRKALLPARAYPVMKWAIEHWQDFLFDISADTGTMLSAARPQIGILLKYHNIAQAGAAKKKAASPAGTVTVLSEEAKAALKK